MNVSLDLVTSVLILGILVTIVFSTNMILMDGSVENRVTQQQQILANNGIQIIEEEVKYLIAIEFAEDSTLRFIEQASPISDSVLVEITKNGTDLNVTRSPFYSSSQTTQNYRLKLERIAFDEIVHGTGSAPFLRVEMLTVSSTDEQIDEDARFYGAASRDIYLKNLHINELFSN